MAETPPRSGELTTATSARPPGAPEKKPRGVWQRRAPNYVPFQNEENVERGARRSLFQRDEQDPDEGFHEPEEYRRPERRTCSNPCLMLMRSATDCLRTSKMVYAMLLLFGICFYEILRWILELGGGRRMMTMATNGSDDTLLLVQAIMDHALNKTLEDVLLGGTSSLRRPGGL